MLSPSRAGYLVALLVAGGCSSSSGDKSPTGSEQASGTSAGSSSGGGVASGAAGGAAGATTGGTSGSIESSGSGANTGTSGSASGSPNESGGSTGASSGSASPVNDAGSGSGAIEGGGAGAGSDSGPSAGPFTCTMVLGLFTTSQWFDSMMPGGASKNFLMDGVDATRWEGKMQKYAYIEKWEDPTNAVWAIATANPCAANADTPDRVVYVAFSPGIPADQDYQMYSGDTKDEAGWEMVLNTVIATIKMKYPSAKEIDILTMGRAPNNVLCSNNNDIDTIIQPYEDEAYQTVAAASNGLVVVGPKYYVPDCATSYIFANDSDYTTTGANGIATQVAAYYVAHP